MQDWFHMNFPLPMGFKGQVYLMPISKRHSSLYERGVLISFYDDFSAMMASIISSVAAKACLRSVFVAVDKLSSFIIF